MPIHVPKPKWDARLYEHTVALVRMIDPLWDGKLEPLAAAEKAEALLAELISVNLFQADRNGVTTPHDWIERQFKTDITDPTAATRQKRHRDGKRDETVTQRDSYRDATVTRPYDAVVPAL